MVLHGRNLFIRLNGQVVAGCRSCSVTTSSELIEVSSPTSGQAVERIPGRREWSVKCSYLLMWNTNALDLSLMAGTLFDVSVVVKMPVGIGLHDVVYNGKAILQTCDIRATIGNIAQGSIALAGSGGIGSSTNLLPSLTEGWQGYVGGSVLYSADYGIQDEDTANLYCPAIQAEDGTQLCFSYYAHPGSLPLNEIYLDYITTDNWTNLSDIEENGSFIVVQKAGDSIRGMQRRAWYTLTIPEDCTLTVNLPTDGIIHKPQLEAGSVPTTFMPV